MYKDLILKHRTEASILLLAVIIVGTISLAHTPATVDVYGSMTCQEMITFSSSDIHGEFTTEQHNNFHTYYYNQCTNAPADYLEFQEDLAEMRAEIHAETLLQRELSENYYTNPDKYQNPEDDR